MVQRPMKVLMIPIIAAWGIGAVLDVESIVSILHGFVANVRAVMKRKSKACESGAGRWLKYPFHVEGCSRAIHR
jgi:hypothetical protein